MPQLIGDLSEKKGKTMLWQTKRDIANLESEVRELREKYYQVSSDLARLLQYMNLVQVTTPETTKLLAKT